MQKSESSLPKSVHEYDLISDTAQYKKHENLVGSIDSGSKFQQSVDTAQQSCFSSPVQRCCSILHDKCSMHIMSHNSTYHSYGNIC